MGQKLMSVDMIHAIEFMFEECFEEKNQKKISYNLPFLQSMLGQFESKRWLSEKQISKLKEIHERATN